MLDPTTVTDTRIGILDLNCDTCRWPLWPHTARTDGGGFYCGDPRWGGSVYCGVHAALAGGGSPLRGLGGMPRGVVPASTDAAIRDVAEVMGDGVEHGSFREQALKFIAWRAERRASRRLDGFGLVRDGRKMSTNEHGCAAPDTVAPENAPPPAGVTAGETAPFSDLASAHEHYSAVSARLNRGPVARPAVAVVAREAATAPLAPAQPPATERDVLAEALALLDEIVESDSNRLALAGLRLLITGKLPGEALYLYGPSGCGKSLMAEVARRIIGPERVLDPADAASVIEVRRTMIAGPCLMTGEMPPGECSAASLIGRAVSLEISSADSALRAALLDRALAGYEVSPESRVALLASDLDVGCLVGLTRSLVLSLGAETSISLDAAQAAVDRFGKPDARPLRMDDIILAVARHYRISRADILSQRRTLTVVRPRQIAMYLCKLLTLRSLPEIGRRMGGRDHTTVLHAVKKIEGLRRQHPALDAEIEALAENIRKLGAW